MSNIEYYDFKYAAQLREQLVTAKLYCRNIKRNFIDFLKLTLTKDSKNTNLLNKTFFES